jgi:hypothetical protein
MMTALLEAFTKEIGEEQVVGAIVLCSLERPIDEAIRHSQSLGPYHRGKPGEWSHTFLIAGPFAAEHTPILDCRKHTGPRSARRGTSRTRSQTRTRLPTTSGIRLWAKATESDRPSPCRT